MVLLVDKALAQNRFQNGPELGKKNSVKMVFLIWVHLRLKELRMVKMRQLDWKAAWMPDLQVWNLRSTKR